VDTKSYISSGIVEAYVLGTIPADEAAILECVMQHNPTVQQAVLEAQQTLEALAIQQAVAPPAALKEAIRLKLDFNTTQKATPPVAEIQKLRRKQQPVLWMAASVALLITVGILSFLMLQQRNENQQLVAERTQAQSELQQLKNLNEMMASARNVTLKGTEKYPDMLANVYYQADGQVYLSLAHMPAAPAGHQYQLWAIVDGQPVDMGVYDNSRSSNMQPMKEIHNPQAFAITIEPEGGSKVPTLEEMVVIGEM